MKILKWFQKNLNDDYYLQPPIHQIFYKFLGHMTSFCSVGDRELWGYPKSKMIHKINSNTIAVAVPLCFISQIAYLYTNFSDLSFDIVGTILSVLPATLLVNVSIISSKFKTYKVISTDFLPKYHLYNFYMETKSEIIKEKLILMEKISRWTSSCVIFFMISTWVGWMTIPVINNYLNRELVKNHTVRLQTCVFLWMPFDYSYNYYYWVIPYLINMYAVFVGVCSLMIFLSINYLFVYNLIGHIQVMKHSIRTSFSDDMLDEDIFEKLKAIARHHALIIQIFKDLQTGFGFIVTTNYLQNLFGNSIILYQITYGGKENLLLYILLLIAYTGGPILMSFVLDEIRRQAGDLPDIVYCMPWEKMSVSNQKIVLLILRRSQDLIQFEGFGGLRAGVAPMISILKTTFSYYVMLKSTIGRS